MPCATMAPVDSKSAAATAPRRSKEEGMAGVYEGLMVVELADRRNQWAGKLLSEVP